MRVEVTEILRATRLTRRLTGHTDKELHGTVVFALWLKGLGAVLAALTLLWLISIPLRDVSIVDPAWGLTFAIQGTVWFTLGADGGRASLALALVWIWALRLGLYLLWRRQGHGEDFRYQEFRRRTAEERYWWLSLFQVFWLQRALGARGPHALGGDVRRDALGLARRRQERSCGPSASSLRRAGIGSSPGLRPTRRTRASYSPRGCGGTPGPDYFRRLPASGGASRCCCVAAGTPIAGPQRGVDNTAHREGLRRGAPGAVLGAGEARLRGLHRPHQRLRAPGRRAGLSLRRFGEGAAASAGYIDVVHSVWSAPATLRAGVTRGPRRLLHTPSA
ncbi:MAG: DUF1295 domain-containing protein [Deltaproteobacteria bacterium]|nr:DUF1295 domain-containing protein [Deltaproteobacteria bacterium]